MNICQGSEGHAGGDGEDGGQTQKSRKGTHTFNLHNKLLKCYDYF